jgi:hypothetical protein
MTNVNLTSTGMIATQAGVPHARILAVIDELHLAPTVTLNGVRYFDAEAVERIQERTHEPRVNCRGDRLRRFIQG